MTRALVTQLVEALEKLSDTEQTYVALDKADAVITAAREYLATEPSGERADSAQWLREFAAMEFSYYSREATQLRKAADMLEADAQPKSFIRERAQLEQEWCELRKLKQAQQAKKVGDSRFESWYSELNQAGKGSKQIAREAYEAGLNETNSQQAKRVPMTMAEITSAWGACIDNRNRVFEIRTEFARAIEAHHGITTADKPTDWSAA